MASFVEQLRAAPGWAQRRDVVLNRIRAMRFGRQAAVLVSMTAIAQLIPLAISPVLTRMFTPADFGVLALYLAGLMIASIAAAGRYDLAVTLAHEEKDADALVLLSVGIALLLGCVTALAFLFWGDALAALLGRPDLGVWMFSMPAGITLSGCYGALMLWLNRQGGYARMGRNRILQTVLTGAISMVLGLAGYTYPALLAGALLGLGITTLMLAVPFVEGRRETLFGADSYRRARAMAHEYRNFPAHVLPGQLVGVFALQLPVFIVSAGFGVATAGLYHLAYRVVAVPSSLVGAALGEVYRQHAADTFRAAGRFDHLFVRTIGTTLLLGLVPLVVLLAFAPQLFAFVFGEEWRAAGDYARVLSVAAFVQFVCLPVDKSAMITGRTGYLLGWNVAMAVLVCGLGGAAMLGDLTFDQFLWLYTLVIVMMYAGDAVFQYRFSRPARQEGDAAQ